MNDDLLAASEALAGAFRTGQACDPVRALVEPHGLSGAYEVQRRLLAEIIAPNASVVGRKIGLTSRSVQTQLGVDQPDFGSLTAAMEFADGAPITAALIQPRVEAEVAFVLERDLDQEDLSLGRVISAVAYALPAIEIVDSRVRDWKISIYDTIADNASSGAFVLGGEPRKLDALDLRMCGMSLERQGEPISVGCGAACLGNPLNALLWLARKMVEEGTPLRAGETILSGALGPMVSVAPGSAYTARIEGLGSVTANFTDQGSSQ